MTSAEPILKASSFDNPVVPSGNIPSTPPSFPSERTLRTSRVDEGRIYGTNFSPKREMVPPSKSFTAAPPAREPHVEIGIRFGNRIRELRQERSLTQVRVAKEFGVDRSYISDLERGRKSICIHTMEIFALGFSLSLSELLDGI